jgi:hypothetical protein
VGGFCYALILVDRATRYNWVYGLKDFLSDSILSALRYFKADAGSYACCFHLDCNAKLFGRAFENTSSTMTPISWQPRLVANRQMVWLNPTGKLWYICHVLISQKKQMPRSFWFFLIVHSAWMVNAIPGKLHGKLASPFLLVHGVGHDERTWFSLFLLCYFHHDKDGGMARSHNQAHTMDGITVG